MAQAQVTDQPTRADRPHVSLADFYTAGADSPVEVVDGELIVMSPQGYRNTRIAHDLYDSLTDFVKAGALGRVLMESTYAPDMEPGRGWVYGARVPDVSFISQERLEAALAEHGEEGPLQAAPDLAVEIVSPSDKYSDLNRKIADYLRYGVRLVWVIDPQTRTVRVITPDDPEGKTFSDSDTLVGAPLLEGWSMPVKTLLDG